MLELERALSTLTAVLSAHANAGDIGLTQEVKAWALMHFSGLAQDGLRRVKELGRLLECIASKETVGA